MALFKVYRGLAENLPAQITDGYCYFTYPDNKFYIDAHGTRYCINNIPSSIAAFDQDSTHRTVTDEQIAEWDEASPNQNAFSFINVGNTVISADSTTDTLTLVAGNNVTLTPDASNDSITIQAQNTTYTLTQGTNKHELIFTPSVGSPTTITIPDNNTSYTLSASGNDIVLTPSSGTAQSLTVPYATNAGTVNGHSIESDVPSGAVFTDTVYEHPESGVTEGTYNSVTVDKEGHVTSGTNPTTLSGYGITDAVEKIAGKGLSTNDYTTAEKNKLSGIAAGAEVNVQSNWNETNSSSDAYIMNKPLALPASDVYDWAKAAEKPSYTAEEVGAISLNDKGTSGGVAELDENGKVPSYQLPSFVDDVVEYSSESEFPTEGEDGKIYVDTSTNLTYRWSGSEYIEISPSLALGETSSTAYRGDRGKIAYDHSQATHARTDATKTEASTTNGNIKINGTETTVYTHPGSGTNPHGTTKSDVGLGNVGNFKAVSTVASQGLTDTERSNARANIGAGTSSLALGETSSTAYRGDRGKIAYDHSQVAHARTDATKTEASSTNGNIVINGTETTVYTHPSGTNPHGTTKSDVGLGNVGNFKAVSTEANQGLSTTEQSNARANIGAGTSSLALGTTSSTAYRGDYGNTAYTHSQAAHARTDATAVGASTTNGNIKINGTETTVYTHPGSGTNPHGTTKSDVGLGNVGNFKAVSTVASQGLTSTEQANARANIGAGTSSFSGSYNDLSNKPTLGTAASKDVPSSGNASSSQVVMGNDSRLTDSRNAADVYSWAKASTKPSYTASEVGAIATTAKGAASGVAELDSSGKVPTSQLPSFVDDVLEYISKSSFPTTGESGKIYVDTTSNLTYRWSGTAYVEISPSLALGETSSTAYRGDRGKIAYDHSQSAHARTDATAVTASTTNGNIKINGTETTVYTHPTGTNPHGTTKSDVGLGNVGNFKAVSTVASQGLSTTEQANARANIGAGTSSFSGSYTDLSNKPTIPTKTSQLTNDSGFVTTDTNTHRPIQVNGTEILGNNTTALNLKAGSNVSITNSSGTVTIAATDTNTWRSVSDAVNSSSSDVSASSKAVKTAYDLAASKTANTGTVTSIATGAGLTGGTITGSGTIKAKLKSETASTLDSATMGSTASRQYAVGVDKSGYLSVNVPWTDTHPDSFTEVTSAEVATVFTD